MASLAAASIVALAALVFFALAVAIVRRYPPVGVGLAGSILAIIWDVPDPPAIIALSGLTVVPADLITLLLLVVAILEAEQLKANIRGWLVPWLFFGVLIAVSLLRGIAEFGLGTAVNEARMMLHFFFATTWGLAIRPGRLKLHTVSLVLGWTLVLVATYHGVAYGVQGAISAVSVSGDLTQTGRILVGPQAMALLLCAGTVFLNPSGSVRRWFDTVSSTVFFGVVVIAQHRSVWAAAVVGMTMVLLWSARSTVRHRVPALIAIGAWLGLIGWVFGIFGSGLFQSALDKQTYAWRSSSWQSLVADAIAKGTEAILVGQPFGNGYLRQIFTGTWSANSAHNWYVTIFLRLGIAGLITFAGILIAALVKARSGQALWTFLIAAIATYSWAYQIDWYLAPWLGIAMSISLGEGVRDGPRGTHQLGSGIRNGSGMETVNMVTS